jgi:hypothetical protein
VSQLSRVRPVAIRFGGSHAQRDVIALTLVEAALRAGRAQLARALAAERTDLKPASPFNWSLTGRALVATGDMDGRLRRGARQRRCVVFRADPGCRETGQLCVVFR